MKGALKYPSQELLKTHFDYDEKRGGLIRKSSQKRSEAVSGSDSKRHVVKMPGDRKNYYVNRLVWIWHNGDIPEGLVVDHINNNTLDDRIENLQAISQSDNLYRRNFKQGDYQKQRAREAQLKRWSK